MTIREDAQAKVEQLKRQAEAAHIQGRSPLEVPLTLKDGKELAALVLALATYFDNHHHDITVNKQERETTGPK